LKTVIYLHGFNSSPGSEKARKTKSYFLSPSSQFETQFKLETPALPSAPLEAISAVCDLVESIGAVNIAGFVGSSLGGYYSLYLQQRYTSQDHEIKTILINPAVRPFDLLQEYIGENKNPYTGECYTVKPEHMKELKSLLLPPISSSENTLLLTQTGDEVLDYQQAVSYLHGARVWVQWGGSHAFESYESVLPTIHAFLCRSSDL